MIHRKKFKNTYMNYSIPVMKQIIQELIHKDYGFYWNETGVNKRLKIYMVFRGGAEFLLFVIEFVIAISLSGLLLRSVGELIDRSSGLYDYYKAGGLKHWISSVFFPFYFFVFLISAISNCLMKSKSSPILFTIQHQLVRWIKFLPFTVIFCFLVQCLFINNFDNVYYSLITIFVLWWLKKPLNAFVVRVNKMFCFAQGTTGVRILRETGRSVAKIKPKKGEGEQ